MGEHHNSTCCSSSTPSTWQTIQAGQARQNSFLLVLSMLVCRLTNVNKYWCDSGLELTASYKLWWKIHAGLLSWTFPYTSYTELLYPMTSLLVLNSLASGSVLLATIRRTLGQNGNKRVSEQSTWEMYIQAISGSVSSQRSTVNELRWQTGNIVRHPTHCPKYLYTLSLSLWAPIGSSQ